MKFEWLKKSSSKTLVVFFNGWGMDSNALNVEAFPNSDLLMFYDYTDLSLQIPYSASDYEKIYLVAWSFGIWVANLHFEKFKNITLSIAINGSICPVNDKYGISENIFSATLNNYDETTKSKFSTRIFGSISKAKEIENASSMRPAEAQKLELAQLQRYFQEFPQTKKNWSRYFAADADKIFPLESMKNCWGKDLIVYSGAHYPEDFLQKNFFREALQKPDIKKSFARHLETYEQYAIIQRHAAKILLEKISESASQKTFETVLEIGAGTGFLTRLLDEKFSVSKFHLNDINEIPQKFFTSEILRRSEFVVADADSLTLKKHLDLVASSSALQWVSNINALFDKIHSSLKSNGIFAFSTFAPDNLKEIKYITSKGLNYPKQNLIFEMLKNSGFEVLSQTAEEVVLHFDSAMEVLKHLKNTGVTGGFSEFWTPSKFKKFEKSYQENFSDAGKLTLTYKPLYFISKK